MNKTPTHLTGTVMGPTRDKRYTIEEEFCGYPQRRNVLRFCGEFIAQSISFNAMAAKAAGHSQARKDALIVEGAKS